MPRNTRNTKVFRTVGFILGLRHPDAILPLKAYGMSSKVLAEGQELLCRATWVPLDRYQEPTPSLLERLEAYQNHWFAILRVVLQRHFPDIEEWTFRKIASTRGLDLILTVDTVVGRLRELGQGTSPFKETGQRAMQRLAQRGFGEAELAQGEAIVHQVAQPCDPEPDPMDDDEAERAVEAMWSWYLEWSVIARKAISNRAVLRRLGFLRSGSSAPLLDDFEDTE